MRCLMLIGLLLLAGCDYDPDFNRMEDQPSQRRYEQSPEQPPTGSISREARLPTPQLAARDQAGQLRRALPWRMQRADLLAGRQSFNRYCAVCHSVLGDGDSYVAKRMSEVKPRNLLSTAMRDVSVGHLYDVAGEGYGMMDGYASALTPHQRWQVVAYLRVLQQSQALRLIDVPAAQRTAIEAELSW